ncbi:hypothetical protein TrVFT333_005732 [Trichoderma virens FT-333]|nr:hypothetical protein TrVFT333_005732 [Trichoderma virens FT-333]
MSDELHHHNAYTLCQLPSESWTRVLVLDPGEFADPITCTLQLYNTDQHDSGEPYEAISYVWGDPTITCSIHVNGVIMRITRNLFTALQQLRSKDTPKRFWTDAVCINQSDILEKGQQVNRMGIIYSNAARVIVWLGPDEEAIAEPAISVIKKFNRLVEKQATPQQFSSWWGPLRDPDGTISQEHMKHVERMFKLPWFTRVWVVQEVGVAKEVSLAWGSAKTEFIEIIQFVCAWSTTSRRDQFRDVKITSNYFASLFDYIWASYIPRAVKTFDEAWFKNSPLLQYEAQMMRERRTLEFEDIIFRCRYIQRATDVRDFVYSSLAHPTARTMDGYPIIDADYTISEAELRLRLFSIISQRSLRFLGLVWHTHKEELTPGLSWCPRFHSTLYENMLGRYDASRNLSIFQDSSAPEIEKSKLKISALLIDEAHLCGEVAGPVEKAFDDSIYDDLKPVLHKIIEDYWSLANESNSRCPSAYEDRLMAFASTLIAAIEKEHHRVIAKQFEQYCRDHCPSISEDFPDNWVDKWGLSQPGDPFFPFRDRCASNIQSKKFFTTMRGYYGTGSPLVQPGDLICIIPTAQTPFIIRRLEGEQSAYHVVCSCYIYGMMFGEAVKKWGEDLTSMRKDIILV